MPQKIVKTATDQINAIRAFNRFYTARLGLLRKRHLDGRFSLTEARALFEIGSRPGVTATSLRSALGIDNGYLSRVIALHVRAGLVRAAASRADAREKLLTLTAAGRRAVAQLDAQSARQIDEMLAPLAADARADLASALESVHALLARAARPRPRIERLAQANRVALALLEEYYESIDVVKRDDARSVRRMMREPHTALWLAYVDGKPAGCVMLRPLPQRAAAGECKRLYVRPSARGCGVAAALMDALEDWARAEGLRWVYLDTMRTLTPAVALYTARSYKPCPRYNDNPQATMFMRKSLAQRSRATLR
jgi:DNA-binding MarR family transcriptional regulator